MRYRYWLTLRPAMPGTVPTRNLERIENFDSRTYNEDAGREVWGYVEYSEPLSDKQVTDYELVKDSSPTNYSEKKERIVGCIASLNGLRKEVSSQIDNLIIAMVSDDVDSKYIEQSQRVLKNLLEKRFQQFSDEYYEYLKGKGGGTNDR